MKANLFFSGSFFCAVVALCVGQFEILKNEAILICVTFALFGSLLFKFALDSMGSLENDVKNHSNQLALDKLANIDQQLLQNNTDNKNQTDQFTKIVDVNLMKIKELLSQNIENNKKNINLLCEIENRQLEVLTKQNEIFDENKEILKQLKTQQETLNKFINQDFLKNINNIYLYVRGISVKLDDLQKIKACEDKIKSNGKKIDDIIDVIEEFADVKSELKNIQATFIEQNNLNRELLDSVHNRYTSVTEKDIKIIDKIYKGLKNEK